MWNWGTFPTHQFLCKRGPSLCSVTLDLSIALGVNCYIANKLTYSIEFHSTSAFSSNHTYQYQVVIGHFTSWKICMFCNFIGGLMVIGLGSNFHSLGVKCKDVLRTKRPNESHRISIFSQMLQPKGHVAFREWFNILEMEHLTTILSL